MSSARSYTNAEMARCAWREVGQRKRVYPNLVRKQAMYQDDADREIATMEAIYQHFKALSEAEGVPLNPQRELF